MQLVFRGISPSVVVQQRDYAFALWLGFLPPPPLFVVHLHRLYLQISRFSPFLYCFPKDFEARAIIVGLYSVYFSHVLWAVSSGSLHLSDCLHVGPCRKLDQLCIFICSTPLSLHCRSLPFF